MSKDRAQTTSSPRFKSYPAYKDSSVEWLELVPENWEIKRLRYSIRLNPTKSEVRGLDPKLSVSFVPMEAVGEYGGLMLESVRPLLSCFEGYTYFRDGDVVVAKITPCFENVKGALAEGLENGIGFGTTELHVLRAGQGIDRRYMFYLSLSDHFRRMGAGSMYGAGGQKRVPEDFIRDFRHPIPSEPEQRTIAAFLDQETARIDALAAKKESLIRLLQEKRAALITRAVTKGLDPNGPMKDSGVEWLGKIPAHWDSLALSRVTLSRCDGPFGSGLKSEHYSGVGVRVIRLQNIGWTDFVDADRAYIDEEYANELGDHSVMVDDLLIAGLGDEGHPVGRACVAPAGIEPAMVKADCFRFRVDRRRVVPRFAAYQLSATAVVAVGSFTTGATRARMNLTATASRKIALPPPEEQQVIVEALDREQERYLAIVAKVHNAIDRLKEYRTALISAAVTGKIDVQGEVA
jgi:type I restriction enzyme S subunit